MSTERSIENLPEEAKRLILDYLRRIEEAEVKKVELIQELAEQIEERGWVPPEYISSFLKKILKEIASDRTIERALGKKKKQKYARYQQLEIRHTPLSTSEKEIEVSSRGSESYTKADGSEGEREADDDVPPEKDDPLFYEGEPDIPLIDVSTELGVTEIIALKQEKEDLTLRLEEALKLADDKDKALERERIQYANLEVELGEAKKNEAAALSTANDRGPTMEELQIKYDEMRAEYAELLEVERLRTSKSDFKSAATLPKQCYVYAVDAINFFVPLKKAKDWAMDHSDPWKKILFEVAPDGQLKAAQFEEPVNDQS